MSLSKNLRIPKGDKNFASSFDLIKKKLYTSAAQLVTSYYPSGYSNLIENWGKSPVLPNPIPAQTLLEMVMQLVLDNEFPDIQSDAYTQIFGEIISDVKFIKPVLSINLTFDICSRVRYGVHSIHAPNDVS